jgi:hypothetical protein
MQWTAFYWRHIYGNKYRKSAVYTQRLSKTTVTATTDMRFHGDQPRTTHFGTVEVGELYWVRLRATLGPTVRECRRLEPEDIRVWNAGAKVISLEPSQDFESRRGERLRRAYETSRDRESTVREFELCSSVIPTVKSETNKESGNWVAESVISQQVPPSRYNMIGRLINACNSLRQDTTCMWQVFL